MFSFSKNKGKSWSILLDNFIEHKPLIFLKSKEDNVIGVTSLNCTFLGVFYSLFEEMDVVATIEEWAIGSEIGKSTSKSVNGPCERLDDSMAHGESWKNKKNTYILYLKPTF